MKKRSHSHPENPLKETDPAITKPVKILMVDDRPENLYALNVILRDLGYELVKANSGPEALEILAADPDFAIVLMDVQMPGMTGFEAVAAMRKDERTKLLPVIFLTANMDADNIYRGYEVGAVDYMIKPLSGEILRAKVSVFVELYKKTKELLAQEKRVKSLHGDIETQTSLSRYSNSLIEASLDPLFTVSPEGKLMDLNEATVRVTGVTREKLIGSDFFNYFTEPARARKVYMEVFSMGSVVNSPLTLRHTSGELTDVFFNGSTYKDSTGSVSGIVIVARDVTEQKRIALELLNAKTAAELATGVAEKAQGKAELATRIAEDAVRAKQQFLSNMSHEIRTPMNAIIGFTKVLMRTDLSERQMEYLQAIKISGDSLIVLINDILDLAKVDAGKMTFESVPFRLDESIAAMLHLFETKIQEKNLGLVKIYDNRIPKVLLGDSVRLHQVILNLLSNAVKFTSAGKITVSVAMMAETGKQVTVRFSVTDTGIGIPENKIAHIFENFQQASSDTTRLYGGTGLGLAIVKQLVEPQGGTVDVESSPGEGSTFSFTLSFLKTDKEVEKETGLIDIDKSLKNVEILVVEDISLNKLLLKTLLRDYGFGFDMVSNGREAIEKLQYKHYDLILMDLQMPVMNGFEATAYIRDTMGLNIPIMALTADVTSVDLEKCREVGMSDYVSKPIDEKILYSKIVSLLKKGHERKKTAAGEPPREKLSKVIDLGYLTNLTKSDPDTMRKVLSLYLEETPAIMKAMKRWSKQNDWEQVQAATHKLMPLFSMVGISKEYEEIAKRIQENSKTRTNTEETHVLLKQLDAILTQACVELEDEYQLLEKVQ
jgi:PAS domain S-box-containing protein